VRGPYSTGQRGRDIYRGPICFHLRKIQTTQGKLRTENGGAQTSGAHLTCMSSCVCRHKANKSAEGLEEREREKKRNHIGSREVEKRRA